MVLSPILNLDCRMYIKQCYVHFVQPTWRSYSTFIKTVIHLLASESKPFRGDAGDRTRRDASELALKFATNRKLILQAELIMEAFILE